MSAAAAQLEKPSQAGHLDVASDALATANVQQEAAVACDASAIANAVAARAVQAAQQQQQQDQAGPSDLAVASAQVEAADVESPVPTYAEQMAALQPDPTGSPGVLRLKRIAHSESSASTECSSSLPSTEPATTPSESSSSNAHPKRLKLAPASSRKSRHLQLPHPLGVKPLGNAFLSEHNSHPGTLGTLARLDDDLIIHVLSLCTRDIASLARLEATSRGLYAFVNSNNSLWRDGFLERFEGRMKKWCGSWKRTYAWHHRLHQLAGQGQYGDDFEGTNLVLLPSPQPPIRTPHLFSDTLFHPFRLSLTPIEHFLAPEALHIGMATIDVSKPGAVAQFRDRHAELHVPAILQGAMPIKDWPCREWTLEHLAMRWPNRFFQCEAVRCKLPTYLSYSKCMEALCEQAQKDDDDDDLIAPGESRSASATPSADGSGDQKQLHQPARRASSMARSNASTQSSQDEGEPSFDPHAIPDESPFYLFDATFADDPHASLEWRVPKIFHQISVEMPDLSGHTAGVRSDLFSLLGPLRPDHRWIIAGPARSGSGWHKDPNGTSAWNAVLTGRKAWMMLPPHVVPPGVYVSDDEAEVTAPLSIAEWLIGFADETRKRFGPAATRPEDRVLVEGVCEAGEVVYVPSGWWHLVVNLEESVALTQNFISPPELGVVLDFMKNKSDQLSGFKKSNRISPPLISAAAAAATSKSTGTLAQQQEMEECEDGADFGVFELFCERLGKFDRQLLASGLTQMADIETKRGLEGHSGRSCSRIVRDKGEGQGAADRRTTWWDRLKQPRVGSPLDGATAPCEQASSRPVEPAQEPLAASASTTVGFSFVAQLDDEELEDVPW